MEIIVGLVPVSVEQTDEEIVMHFSNGAKARWYHAQGCCEDVHVEDVIGDWSDLYGHPILLAEERVNEISDDNDDSQTWTFYAFRNIGGSVDVRWHGSSNGYYSKRVDFEFIPSFKEMKQKFLDGEFEKFRNEMDCKFKGL